MKVRRMLGGTLIVAALALAPGCGNTAEGVKQDSKENAAAAQKGLQATRDASGDAAEHVGEKAAEIGHDVAEGARDVAEAFAEGADDVGSDVAAGKQTLDVKAALLLDQSIDASDIRVDTDAETRTVTLRGSVPSAGDREAAEKLAGEKAEGYKVVNLLEIAVAS